MRLPLPVLALLSPVLAWDLPSRLSIWAQAEFSSLPRFLPRTLAPLGSSDAILDRHVHMVLSHLSSPSSDPFNVSAVGQAAEQIHSLGGMIGAALSQQLRNEWVLANGWLALGGQCGDDEDEDDGRDGPSHADFASSLAFLSSRVVAAIQAREYAEALTVVIQELALGATTGTPLDLARSHMRLLSPDAHAATRASIEAAVVAADEIYRKAEVFRQDMLADEAWLRRFPGGLASAETKGAVLNADAGVKTAGLRSVCDWEGQLMDVLKAWRARLEKRRGEGEKARAFRLGSYVV